MDRLYIDIHILQTVPPSNVNRDDTGSPKTAVYGGVRRARVSSQAWKRTARRDFGQYLDSSELGVRTTRLVELIADRVAEIDPALTESSEAWAEAAITRAGIKLEKKTRKKASGDEEHPESKYLVFISRRQIDSLARAIVQAAAAEPDPASGVRSLNAKALLDRDHSVDISLFGRMVADDSDLNVDAACQVAHAISVHPVDNEYDYYTAVDDEKARSEDEDAGAGMIGTVEYNSSTLYRYATINVPQLLESLGDEKATRRAVEAFIRSFATSMPTGKQNTFANRTLPDAVVVRLRSDQPINLVGAFEDAVRETQGRVVTAAERLARHDAEVREAFGGDPIATWVVGVGAAGDALASMGDRVSLDDLVSRTGAAVAEHIGGQ